MPSPGAVAAQVQLYGSSEPLLSAATAAYDFSNADFSYSTGGCVRTLMSFSADAFSIALAKAAGGNSPVFDDGSSRSDQGELVCAESTDYNFTVIFSPDPSFTSGVTKVDIVVHTQLNQ
eukprot:gene9558-9720_t